MASNWDWSKVFTVAATGAVAALGGYFASSKGGGGPGDDDDAPREGKGNNMALVPVGARPRRPEMTLFHSFPLKSTRCVWLILELGIEDDVQVVQMQPSRSSESKLAQYEQQVNPHGTVPALQINQCFSIVESSAICMYLADLYTRLVPWIQNRAEYYNWMTYCSVIIDPILDKLHEQLVRLDPSYQDRPLIEELLHRWKICALSLCDRLKSRKYICGNKFTATDCVLGYSIWWASLINRGQLLREHPALISYLIRMKSRPGFRETFTVSQT